MLNDELARCLHCKVPKCRANCPVSTPIPDVIALYQEGRMEEARELLFANNPLSAVCSIVCPHERNCYGNCIRALKSEPVPFFRLEQELSRDFITSYEPPVVEKNDWRVGVIGAGPAGITMSILLALRGFQVTLIEAQSRIGGVLRYGIPDFRLPREIIDAYDEVLHRLGVIFKPNTFIGSTHTLADMFIDGYDAVFIATGTAKPNKLGLLGETLGNVHYAIDYLKTPGAYRLGKEVVVVGAGNVALDAARHAVRAGSVVTLLNNRRLEDMTGNRLEYEEALEDGVRFVHLQQTIRLEPDGVRCVAVDPVDYEEDFSRVTRFPADTIIVAIGQGPQGAILADTEVSTKYRGLLDADESGRTSEAGVFAAGDIVTGPKTVVEAVAFTRRVADEIEAYCRSK